MNVFELYLLMVVSEKYNLEMLLFQLPLTLVNGI
ncbi:hypothetical protein SAMN05443543_101473 [Flavobacterium flevense]|nr:hypothetical protein SAMN05443543_101473 [Flavobacterium flevense]